MKLKLSTAVCPIIDTGIYSELLKRTKKENQQDLRDLFEVVSAQIIRETMGSVFRYQADCDNIILKSENYNNYGRKSVRWDLEFTRAALGDILVEYILQQLGESKINQYQLHLNDVLYSAAENNGWLPGE